MSVATFDIDPQPFWRIAEPGDVGFAGDLADRLDAGVRSGLLRNLHAVLVARGDALVIERYDDGPDENWGRPIGTVAFGRETLHDLRSVTKSIVGLLYGIALDRGLVPPPEARLLDQFPEYPDLAGDPRRSERTVLHALTMTLGMEWDEMERPYTDPLNSEIAMESAPDRYRFVLDRPLVADPGSRWTYSGGAVALIGALIERGSGLTLPEFAAEALFAPLGIEEFEWSRGSDGVASAASGLRLRARDLLRIGRLLLSGGEFGGRRIVSGGWIDAAFTPAVEIGDGMSYSDLWYLGDAPVPAFPEPQAWAAGFGNGGQRLWLMPAADLAVVIFSNDYNSPVAWVTPTRIWREIVLAQLVRA